MKIILFRSLLSLLSLLLLLLSSSSYYAFCYEIRISDASNFSSFASDVNSGTTYSGTTVYLESDLYLPGITSPIGTSSNSQFRGTFDGQGHILNNIKIYLFSAHVGLFGYSAGLTIRNVVLGSSCSVTCARDSGGMLLHGYVGGLIGYCHASGGPCTVENSVNMASVTFSATITKGCCHLGGIAGNLNTSYFSKNPIHVKNCVNYGTITHSGNGGTRSYIGGIVGYLSGLNTTYTYVQNCLNYGETIFTGSTSTLVFGGTAGYGNYTHIENCASAGKISSITTLRGNTGTIVGGVNSYAYINYCYYTSVLGGYNLYGSGTPVSIEGSPNSTSSVDSKLINNLNDYTSKNDTWNRWLLNANSNEVCFTVNYDNKLFLSSQILLLPSPADNGEKVFSGWYKSELCNEIFESTSVTEAMTLYGLYGVVVNVTFDANGGTETFSSKNVIFDNAYGDLPEINRTGYTFAGWFTEGNVNITSETQVTNSSDHTLTAQWTINKYTLKFVFDNGTEEAKTLDFNSPIVYPEVPAKEGYSFIWNSTDDFMPAQDLTIAGQWAINNYTLIFDYGNGTITTQVLNYNEEIAYPMNVTRKGYTFKGWSENVTNMPAHNLTITAIWEELKPSSQPSFPLDLIVEIVVPILVVIIIIIIVIFVLMRKKYKNEINERKSEIDKPLITGDSSSDGYCRVVAMSKAEVEGSIPAKATKSILSNLYTKSYVRPTMKEALMKAKLTDEQIEMVCSACNDAATINTDEGKLFDGFTKEDAAALAMYTYDFGHEDFECNPYRIINRSIAERNYAGLQKASGLLYLVMTALRKLPRVTGEMLYRGVRSEVSLSKGYYHKGNIIMWPALSSTSPDMEATKTFLAKGSKSGKATGTLFIIEGGWGYDIQPYSLFPDEAEILVEPERRFEVTGMIEAEGLTFVNLKMLDTPLVLPEVFGGDWK